MRITLATTAAIGGGVLRHLLDLAAGLDRRGHDVTVSAPRSAPRAVAAARAAGLAFSALEEAPPRADVWHLHLADTFDPRAVRLLLRARTGRWGATVVTEHLPRTNASDPSLEPGPRTRGAHLAKTVVKRAQLLLVDEVIVVSEGSGRFLRDRYRLGTRSVTVVPNAVPPMTVGLSPDRPDEPFSVVSVGALNVQKGHDVLIGAAAGKAGRWRAAILGDGAQRDALRLAVDTTGAPVELLGWQDDVSGLLSAADALCQPSRWEASSYAALEAMALGLPVVASRVDGLEDIVVDGVTGLLVPPADSRALADALDALAGDPDRARAMGRAGRERVTRLFGVDAMVDATLDVYARAR